MADLLLREYEKTVEGIVYRIQELGDAVDVHETFDNGSDLLACWDKAGKLMEGFGYDLPRATKVLASENPKVLVDAYYVDPPKKS